jgi:tetratricopeptide (TPR) repeat protein
VALEEGWASYHAGDYAKAIPTLEKFLDEFGKQPAFEDAKRRVLYLLSLSNVRLGQWDAALSAIQRFRDSKGPANANWEQEINFWRGVALIKTGQLAEGRAALDEAMRTTTDPAKRFAALLLAGSSFTQEGNEEGAATFYAQARGNLEGTQAAQVTFLELEALVRSGDLTAAVEAAAEGFDRFSEMPRLAGFQIVVLQLAEQLIAADQPRDAIRLLRLVRSSAETLNRQQQRLDQLAAALAATTETEPNELATANLERLRAEVEVDKSKLNEIANFDALVRFRLASAFLNMNRYHELAYVLDDMLENLPPDPVVERASDTLIRSYMQVGRWPMVVETARKFAEKFPDSDALPGVMLLEAQGLQEQQELDGAEAAFTEMLKRFPQNALAPEAKFLRAFNNVLREDYETAISEFEKIARDHPASPVGEKALFWIAESQSIRKVPEAAVAAADAYLAEYPEGSFAADALYRKAYSLHALRDYEQSVPLLDEFIANDPLHVYAGEALLLKADALLVAGDTAGGLEILREVPDGTYGEEAQFRIGKVYRLTEDLAGLRDHFEKYLTAKPTSARLAEAVYWIGWSWQADPEKRNAVYWDAIERFADVPAQWGVSDIFEGLMKANGGEEARDALATRLREKLTELARTDQRVRKLNLTWALARVIRKSDPDKARDQLVEAAALVDSSKDNPRIQVDVADALVAADQRDDAAGLYAEIRRWNPTSGLNDRVFAALGLMALEDGRAEEAVGYFERFEREVPSSSLRGQVLLAMGEALDQAGRLDEAKAKFEDLLELKSAPKRQKAAALLGLGRIEVARGEYRKAIAPFQRVYVLYSAFAEPAAEAYLETGKALEKLDDPLGAARTYLEFLEQERLVAGEAKPLAAEARQHLDRLPPAIRAEAESLNRAAREATVAAATGEVDP